MDTAFTKNDQRAIMAELLGTMFFVIVGCGTVVAVGGAQDTGGLVAIALAHGIGILVAAAWTGNLSGGHINPVVTLAMMVTRHITPAKGVAYIIAQLTGASLGALLLKWMVPNVLESATSLGSHHVTAGVAKGEALLYEIVLTAFLLVVIYGTAVSKKGWGSNAPIAIGLAVAVIHFVAVPITGASVNPARTFGPALITNSWNNGAVSQDWWIYFLGPAIGALIVAAGWLVWRDWGEDSLEEPTGDPVDVSLGG